MREIALFAAEQASGKAMKTLQMENSYQAPSVLLLNTKTVNLAHSKNNK